jgi:hypothetical protein
MRRRVPITFQDFAGSARDREKKRERFATTISRGRISGALGRARWIPRFCGRGWVTGLSDCSGFEAAARYQFPSESEPD